MNEFDDLIVSAIVKIFNSEIEIESVIINQILNALNELVRASNLTNRTNLLRNGLFYLIYNLAGRIIKNDKKLYSQIFLLIDIVNGLIDNIGKFDSNQTVNYNFNLNYNSITTNSIF